MSGELRKKFEAGEFCDIDAKATLDQAEATMWNRYRAAEIEQAETQKKSELDGIRKRIELRLQAMSEDLRSKVAKGEISGTDAKKIAKDTDEGGMIGQVEERCLRMIKMVTNREMTIEQMRARMNRAMQMDD